MSDNPLADWLRARQDAEADADGVGGDGVGRNDAGPDDASQDVAPAGAGQGAPASWPQWGGPAAAPADREPAPWERPPDQDGDAPPRRRHLLLLAAALPWAVAGGLGVAALTGGPAAPEGAQHGTTSDGQHGSGGDGQPASTEDDRSGSATPAAPPPTAAELSAGEPALGAAAALAVRLSVTSAEADDAGGPRRYVDLAVADGVHRAGDVTVVTVAAVVLEGSGERWHTSRPARFAVPLRVVDGQAIAVGEPWPLAPAATAAEALRWEPAGTDTEGVTRALEAAGYTEVEGLEVDGLEVDARAASEADRLPLLRARVQARGPGESAPRDHEVWLRAEPEPAVLGAER